MTASTRFEWDDNIPKKEKLKTIRRMIRSHHGQMKNIKSGLQRATSADKLYDQDHLDSLNAEKKRLKAIKEALQVKPYVSLYGGKALVLDTEGNVLKKFSSKEHGQDYKKLAYKHLDSLDKRGYVRKDLASYKLGTGLDRLKEDEDDIEFEDGFVLGEAGRFRIVKARVRKGVVQRRRKVSNIKGYTFRKRGSGPAKLIRMSPAERRHRRLGQRRGKIKRRAKLNRIRMKMKRSLRKRKAYGIR